MKTLFSESNIILEKSVCPKFNFEPSIENSPFTRNLHSGNSAVKKVLPDSDLQVKVANGTPGLSDVRDTRHMRVIIVFCISGS